MDPSPSYHDIINNLLCSSVDNPNRCDSLRNYYPYINRSSCNEQTGSMSCLFVFSQYDQQTRNPAMNRFLFDMGREGADLRVGALGMRGLQPYTNSRSVYETYAKATNQLGPNLWNEAFDPTHTRSHPTPFLLSSLEHFKPKADSTAVMNDRIMASLGSKCGDGHNPHYISQSNFVTGTNQCVKASSPSEHVWKRNMNCSSDAACQKRSIDWEKRVQMLVEFKNKHGHCAVPQSHPLLGAWVKWQREKYALYEAGKTSHFTQEKIEQLNALGFIWRLRRKRTKRNFENESISENQSREVTPQHLISSENKKRKKGSSDG